MSAASESIEKEHQDMTLRHSSLYALAAIVLLLLTKAWSAAEGECPPALVNSHASLKVYPSAIISLKDSKTGNLFYVESNGRCLVAFDKNGGVLWNVDVFETLPHSPLVGAPVVRHLTLGQGRLTVT